MEKAWPGSLGWRRGGGEEIPAQPSGEDRVQKNPPKHQDLGNLNSISLSSVPLFSPDSSELFLGSKPQFVHP